MWGISWLTMRLLLSGTIIFVAGCGNNMIGPQGPEGAAGPAGRGYDEVIMQPGPHDSSGKDINIGASCNYYGDSPLLYVGYSSDRALLYFDVTQSGLPTGANIIDAILTITCESSNATNNDYITCKIYPMTTEWSDSVDPSQNANWIKKNATQNWKTPGGDYLSASPLGEISLTPQYANADKRAEIYLNPSYVQSWINGNDNYGIIIVAENEGNTIATASLSFISRDGTSNRPSLKLIYIK